MIDRRIYRAAFLPALVALVVVLFSLEPRPEPLRLPVSPITFDRSGAMTATRQIIEAAPSRAPGTDGDAAAADLVLERFRATEGEISEQPLESEGAELRNLILTLPGDSPRQVALLAARDSAEGEGAAGSAAATGALIAIAEDLAASQHQKTLVLVSTTGASDGAAGARELAEHYPDRELIDAAIVLSQPGADQPDPPFVLPWSQGPQSTSAQLARTAADTVREQVGSDPGLEGFLGDLLRLALPTGVGEQAVLIEQGVDAVGISSAGERPLPPARDTIDALSAATLAELGQATLSLLLAVDAAPEPPKHGPSEYLTLAGNLVPGWSVGLLGLALILPAAAAAADGFARAVRRGQAGPRELAWVLGRALPFLAALLVAYLLALSGLISRPRFPYDPGRFPVDWGAAVALVIVCAALAGAWVVTDPLRVRRRIGRAGLVPALGLVTCAVVLGVWLINAFLAFLLIPAAHAWLAADSPDRRSRVIRTATALTLALIPPLVALVYVADRLEVGATAPWHLLLMTMGGQLSAALALLGCVGAGCLVALLAIARAPEAPSPQPRISVRGRTCHPEPPGRIAEHESLRETGPASD